VRKSLVFLLAALLMVASISCTNTQKGAILGSGGGAVLGGIIGKATGNTAAGAIIGGAVGGAAGATIGHYMDEQAAELEADLEGATIERVGEGIKVTFDSGILFAVNKADLTPEAQASLANLAEVLIKYEDTNILIEGHTDADGPETYNQTLSEKRSNSVSHYLASRNVMSVRMSTIGYGESQPVADNGTSAGKAANRRVEVAIMANDNLKKVAAKKVDEG